MTKASEGEFSNLIVNSEGELCRQIENENIFGIKEYLSVDGVKRGVGIHVTKESEREVLTHFAYQMIYQQPDIYIHFI